MQVLICLLGLSPGVVTGAYYALYHGWGIEEPVQVGKVVTLGTSARGIDRFEGAIAEEFKRWHRETGIQVQYDEACRLRIAADDLRDEASVRGFQAIISRLLRQDYRNDEVYLVVAGGRKSMAAIAAVSAQLYGYGVQGMYHLYVDKGLEEDGSPERFWVIDRERRQRVMRPSEGECRLVDVAFFQIRPGEQGAQLVLRGQMQEYMLEYLAENPGLATLLAPDTKGDVLGYVFEVQVAGFLRNEGYSVRQSARIGPHEVDVYAERGDEILVCECQFRGNLSQPIEAKKIHQAIERLQYIHEYHLGRRVVAWVVSTAGFIEDEINLWPKIDGFAGALQVWQARLRPGVVRSIEEKGFIAVLRGNWIEEMRRLAAGVPPSPSGGEP